MNIRRLTFALATTATLFAAACSDEAEEPTTTSTPPGDTGTLSLELSGLEPLGAGFVYEGWLIVDGEPVTAGRFNVEADTSTYDFELPASELSAASTYVLTIEPETGDDPAPSDVHVLAGDISGGAASLTIGHMAALGTDFADAMGDYILETPTSMASMDDYNQGIWWLVMDNGTPMAGLGLPELPAGWAYEGWVVGADGPVSTGTFTAADMADSDGAGASAGPDGAPPFPGQDFISPATDLVGYMAVISVEPVPDDSPAPFALKPLVDTDVEDLGAGMPQMMDNMSANNPTGAVTIVVP